MNDIKIFVSCHEDSYVPKNKYLYPIQVGAALSPVRFSDKLADNIGDNISSKNKNYCELTAQYWAWKNVEADYYGFYHYRRYISFSDTIIGSDPVVATIDYLFENDLDLIKNTENEIEKIVPNYDIITVRPRDLGEKTVFQQFQEEKVHNTQDLEICLEIIKEYFPEYYNTAFHYLNSNQIYYCNMYILKSYLFKKYSEWIFQILEEFNKRKDLSKYNCSQYRVSGYLAERLWGIFYLYTKENCPELKCLEQQRIHVRYTNKLYLSPIISSKANLPIVMSSSSYYLPFVDVLIRSIMHNSNQKYFYDFIILNTGLSKKEIEVFQKEINVYDNISVRFLDITPIVKSCNFHTRNHVPIQTWYRLIVPYLLEQYKKVVYLDSDLIVNDDISKIFEQDLSKKIIAATKDLRVIASSYTFERRKNYCINELNIENIDNYFQAGVLVINLPNFRKFISFENLLQKASSKNWELMDQDLLNSLLPNESVLYLDSKWDVVVDYQDRCKSWIDNLPHELHETYIQSQKSPSIIHFGGPYKPWSHENIDCFFEFWKYARKSYYYEFILMRSISEKTKNSTARINGNSNQNYISSRQNGIWKIVNTIFPVNSKRRNIIKKILKINKNM